MKHDSRERNNDYEFKLRSNVVDNSVKMEHWTVKHIGRVLNKRNRSKQSLNPTIIICIIVKSIIVFVSLFQADKAKDLRRTQPITADVDQSKVHCQNICLLKRSCMRVKTGKPQLSLKCLYQPTFARFTIMLLLPQRLCLVKLFVPVVRLRTRQHVLISTFIFSRQWSEKVYVCG